ncbi:hypothetical protein GIB67_038416 [Kingdonia uniflora]|uniref:SAWADEE domain-containing protein n=1 Tax=Kingdonia uniflora TaxID=39325 RepID=A0A7J7NP17_9MAGN|nr:hypothetical protein GIB67_038416 [Kingdonia uniflora]
MLHDEVRVRFAGFGAEEDEWVNVRKNVRQRSLPCEASECVAVLPGDLILCFQEGRDQALYFDAHVIDSQRRRHDVRGCRCRFLVKYDHDESEEIVPLRKVCRRPESDYRLHLLHASKEVASMDLNKVGRDTSSSNPRGTNSSIGAEKTQQRQVKTQEISTGNMVVTSVPSLAKPLELNKMGGHTSSISTPRAMSTSVGVETTQGYVRPEVNAEDDVVIISPPSHTNNPVDKDITIVATPVAPVATGDASLPVNAAAATATSDATSAVDTTTT